MSTSTRREATKIYSGNAVQSMQGHGNGIAERCECCAKPPKGKMIFGYTPSKSNGCYIHETCIKEFTAEGVWGNSQSNTLNFKIALEYVNYGNLPFYIASLGKFTITEKRRTLQAVSIECINNSGVCKTLQTIQTLDSSYKKPIDVCFNDGFKFRVACNLANDAITLYQRIAKMENKNGKPYKKAIEQLFDMVTVIE